MDIKLRPDSVLNIRIRNLAQDNGTVVKILQMNYFMVGMVGSYLKWVKEDPNGKSDDRTP